MTRNGKRSPIALRRSWRRDEVLGWAAGDLWVRLLAEGVLALEDPVDRMGERVLLRKAAGRARADRLRVVSAAQAVLPAAEVRE